MRFLSHMHSSKRVPTLYIRTKNPDPLRNLTNVLREDFDYEGLEETWIDYIVVEEEILHLVSLIRVCYNTDTIVVYNPFGDQMPTFTYRRMRVRK